MKYVIMCGGVYNHFNTPRPLIEIRGERLIDRTIRLLRENGCEDICISSNDPIFDSLGVPRLEHTNTYVVSKDVKLSGYWLDAFYPHFSDDTKVTFIFGDVYYTENAIKTIVEYKTDGNILFGTGIARNKLGKNWGEPFAYMVNDYKTFMDGVRAVKKLQDEGKTKRIALVWELYRYLNGLDINVQAINDDTYVCIDDGTIDIDEPIMIDKLNNG